jgi:molecular chaperone GrpE (heat shock protein)
MKENIENNLPESEEPLEASNDSKVDSNEIEKLRIESNGYKEQLIRARAELENQRKRLERKKDWMLPTWKTVSVQRL